MGVEIERKFLIRDDTWREHASAGNCIWQGYLCEPITASVRVRISGDRAWLNIKGAQLGVSRSEFNYSIPLQDARQMMESLCGGSRIDKIRYLVEHQGRTWEIDVFEGENKGLVVAEIELQGEDETFPVPPWAGEEVSHDPRYYNVNLIKHPFSAW